MSRLRTIKTTPQSDPVESPINELADALKAAGHPSRLEILRQLALRERCCGGDICDCLPLAQSTISQHLELLKSAGLVEWRQEGTRSIYTLNRSRLNRLASALSAIGDAPSCGNSDNESKSK